MLFLLSIIVLLISVMMIVSLFRLTSFSEKMLAWALLSYSIIVFVFQLANLGNALNSTGTILLIQSIGLFIVIGLWLVSHRPPLLPNSLPKFQISSILREKKNWPILILFAVISGTILLYLILIYIVPPNNNDALAIHIARIIKWKQLGSYFPWETPFTWQLTFPVNAQLTYLWTILFTNSDHFIAYIPFLSGLITSLLVYLLAREYGFNKRPSIFAALIWLTFPVVQLHLTSVRHDLISTWLFVSSLYFLIRWGKSHQAAHLVLSALALGLVIGTNFSIAAYLPGLVVMLILWFFTRQYTAKQMTLWAGCTLAAFMLFSSPIFISNWIHYHSPVGPDAATMTSAAMSEEMPIVKYLLINTTRWCYQLLDFSWLPKPLGILSINSKAWIAQQIQAFLHINLEGNLATMNAHEFHWDTFYQLQEDEAWFGWIGAGLIFPTSLIAFIQGLRKRKALLLAPFIFFITSMLTCSLIRPGWTPYDGRYFMPLAALCTALLPMWLQGKKWGTRVQYVLLGLSIFSVAMVVAYNPAKQVVGGAAVWSMNRIDRMTRQSYTSKEMLYLVEGAIPEDATVGIATNYFDYQEYGVFGENFTRSIVNVFPPENVADTIWLEQRGVDYLLILITEGYPAKISADYHYVESLGDWVVYSTIIP